MASTTWNVSKDSRIANRNSDGYSSGAGKSNYNPFGLYNGYLYRALLGFSYSFSGMVSITSATLHVTTGGTGGYVESGSSAACYIRRLSASWSEGTAVSLSSTNAVEWSNQPGVTGTTTAFNITNSNNTADSVDITTIIQEAFAAGTFYGLRLYSQNEGNEAYTHEIKSRELSSATDPYISVTYETNQAPYAPTSLSPTGNQLLSGLTPTFTGSFSDPDSGDLMANAQILVYEDNGTTVKWDSGSFSATGPSFSRSYSGAALTGNTYYRWIGRTADDSGVWGPYSAQQRFKVNSTPNAPSIYLSQSPTTDVKTLTPTFNMTHSDPDPSDSSMLGYRILVQTSGGSAIWDSGDVAVSATVSKAVTYASTALNWQTGYRWCARTKDSNGVWGAYTGWAYFTTHTTGTPISLSPNGTTVGNLTPTMVGYRATTADTLTSAQIRVYASNGTTLIQDTGTFTAGVTSTAVSRAYNGSVLSYGTTYKWQMRVTSSVGGTSAYSALYSFTTPSAATPQQTTPVGDPITTLTPTFTGSWSDTLKGIHIIIYTNSGGTAVHWDQGDVGATVSTSYSYVYAGTALAWNTTYWWKIRVQRNADSVWQPYTGLTSFTTDSAGIPTLDAPSSGAWLGAPLVLDQYDDITGVTNGGSAATSLETGAGLFQNGIGSLKIAISGLGASATSYTYRTFASPLDLSDYGKGSMITSHVYASSLTNISTMRMRFEFGSSANYEEFNVIPAGTGAFYSAFGTKGTPTATAGTVDWSNVTAIGLRVVASGGGSVTSNIYLDNLYIGSVNPYFNGTTYNSEVLTYVRVRVYAANQSTLVWDSGDVAASTTKFVMAYGGATLTAGVNYYWQARYTKSTGPTGDYSALSLFKINSAPSIPTSLSPASGGIVADSTVPQFYAVFNDSEKSTHGDSPTYMEVEVYRNSDSALAYTLITKTGLSGAGNTIYDGLAGTVKKTGAAAPIVYETEYQYRVRYYDQKGSVGYWSSYTTFKPSQSPTTTITSPTDAGSVSTPSFNVTWSMSSPGGKGQNAYLVKVIRVADSVTIVETPGWVYSSATSWTVPEGYLVNGLDYELHVRTLDPDGLWNWDGITVTANWAAPDPIQNVTVTDDASLSSTVVQWEESNLSGDFRKYVIYRKASTDVDWNVLDTLTNQSTVTYYDYTAANTVSYEYMMTQYQIIPGDVDLESAPSDSGVSMLDTGSWFVVGADRSESHIFELPVLAAPFAEPVQQEIFEPLGTSRKVIIRGKVMGAEGMLQLKWPTSDRETAIVQISYIRSFAGPHILKSPFGDVWLVEFSGPTKDYEHGGHLNAAINWTEVA